MKLYVDDIRPAPEGWTQARTVTEAIRFLARYGSEVTEISLDHDISYAVEVAGTQRPFPSPEDFTAVAQYVRIFYLALGKVTLPKIYIHSANPVGADRIKDILCNFVVVVKPELRVNRLESEL